MKTKKLKLLSKILTFPPEVRQISKSETGRKSHVEFRGLLQTEEVRIITLHAGSFAQAFKLLLSEFR